MFCFFQYEQPQGWDIFCIFLPSLFIKERQRRDIYSFQFCARDKRFSEFPVADFFSIINEKAVAGLTVHLAFVVHIFWCDAFQFLSIDQIRQF